MSGLNQKEMTKWRDIADEVLMENNFACLSPTNSPLAEKPSYREIVDNNKFQIRNSDLVLAEIDFKEPSIGTIGEIVYAHTIGKPVIIWGTNFDIIYNPWITGHATKHFDSLDEALYYIVINYRKAVG